MKKILLLSLMTISMVLFVKSVNAQSQRLVLTEECTQASCGPCAAANPAYNAMIDANTSKVVALKYQVNWPGVDPMNTQTQTWVAPRVSLYGVTGVPNASLDGINPPGSGAYSGYPGYITQPIIDAEYAVASPFTMVLSFNFTPAYDSVKVRCIYTCTQAVTMTTPKLQLAMTEQHIHFATAPGSNGETDFYEVMRCMYPDGNGTTLKTSWSVGDKDSLVIKAKVPTYIYNKAEIAFVAFIQDNTGFAVQQAAYAAPQPMALDASVSALNNIPSMQCTATFTPTIYLKNTGTTTLTSATISYKIDNGTATTQPWTGSLAYGDSVLITLPMVTGTTGTHTFTASVSAPNGGSDQNTMNDAITKTYNLSLNTAAALPFSEGFVSATFPPANWILSNVGNASKWKRSSTAGGFGHTTSSAYIDFYNFAAGTNDMIVAPIDLSSATKAVLTFSVAHAQYTGYNDELQVLVSTDCGTTWNSVYDKIDPALATAPANTASEFVPTSTQWRTDTVNLNAYLGQAKVFVSFHGITGYGNDLYIDDINITQTVGVNEISSQANSLNVFPNPFTNNTNVEFSIAKPETASFAIYNLLGEKVLSINEKTYGAGKHLVNINASELSEGIYYLYAIVGDQKFEQKLTVVK